MRGAGLLLEYQRELFLEQSCDFVLSCLLHNLFLSYKCEAVAKGENHLFNARIGSDIVIEGLDALCLVVAVVGLVYDVAVPERVVSEDEASGFEDAHHHLVAVAVGTFVAIHKGHIEGDTQFRCFFEGIADDEVNLVGHLRSLYPRAGEVLHLVVDLEGVELSVAVEPFTVCPCRILRWMDRHCIIALSEIRGGS